MNKTKQKILEEATKMFADFGYDSVSMSVIAGKLDITKAALYYHFKSKEELFFAILQNEFDLFYQKMKEALEKKDSVDEKIETFVDTFLDISWERSYMVQFMKGRLPLGDGDICKYMKDMKQKMFALVLPLMDCFPDEAGYDREIFAHMFLSVLHSFAFKKPLCGGEHNWDKKIIKKHVMGILTRI